MVETFRSSPEVYRFNKTGLIELLDGIVAEMREESMRRNEGGLSPLFAIYLGDHNIYRAGRMLLEDLEGTQLEIHAEKYRGETEGTLSLVTIGIINVPVSEDLVELCMHRKRDLAINPSPIYDLIEEYGSK